MRWERIVKVLSAARPYTPVHVRFEDTGVGGTAVLRLVDQDPSAIRMWFAVHDDEFVVELAKRDLQQVDPADLLMKSGPIEDRIAEEVLVWLEEELNGVQVPATRSLSPRFEFFPDPKPEMG